MKLLHIISSLDPVHGGPVEGLAQQCRATFDIRAREVLTLDSPEKTFLADFPARVHAIGEVGPTTGLGRYRYTRKLIPWLKENARNYDVIITHGLWNYASFGAAQILPKLRVPYYSFTHGMLDPWFNRKYPVKAFFKQIFWLAGEGRLLSGARGVLFTADEEARLARKTFWGHDYREVVVGYGTRRPPEYNISMSNAFHAAVPSLMERPYLLFLSRIHEKKGCDLLIKGFSQLTNRQDLQIVVAGPDSDDLTRSLVELSVELGIADRVHWAGPLFGDEKWGAFYGCEAFILPSHQENFGIVVAEALACGKPVLITDKVNIHREVSNSGAGIVSNDNLEGVSLLFRHWAEMDSTMRAEMGLRARALFDEKFDMNAVAISLLKLISDENGFGFAPNGHDQALFG